MVKGLHGFIELSWNQVFACLCSLPQDGKEMWLKAKWMWFLQMKGNVWKSRCVWNLGPCRHAWIYMQLVLQMKGVKCLNMSVRMVMTIIWMTGWMLLGETLKTSTSPCFQCNLQEQLQFAGGTLATPESFFKLSTEMKWVDVDLWPKCSKIESGILKTVAESTGSNGLELTCLQPVMSNIRVLICRLKRVLVTSLSSVRLQD